MLPTHVERAHDREKILAGSIRSIAADLRLIELADLVVYLRTGQFASVGALVQASIELSFKPDTLCFAYSGDVRLDWTGSPQIAFDLEFHHDGVHVYFRLLLEPVEAGVEILCVSFDKAAMSPEANTVRLKEALKSARLN